MGTVLSLSNNYVGETGIKKAALSEQGISSPDLLLMCRLRLEMPGSLVPGARTNQVWGGPLQGYPTSLLLCPASPFNE